MEFEKQFGDLRKEVKKLIACNCQDCVFEKPQIAEDEIMKFISQAIEEERNEVIVQIKKYKLKMIEQFGERAKELPWEYALQIIDDLLSEIKKGE